MSNKDNNNNNSDDDWPLYSLANYEGGGVLVDLCRKLIESAAVAGAVGDATQRREANNAKPHHKAARLLSGRRRNADANDDVCYLRWPQLLETRADEQLERRYARVVSQLCASIHAEVR